MEEKRLTAITGVEGYADEEEDTQKDKYLTFAVGNESYGLGIYSVTEILGIQDITEIPDMPDCIRGVINLRGKVIPVMDIRKRFHMEMAVYDDRTCIIVIETDDQPMGLIVDTVKEVLDIPPELIDPPPGMGIHSKHDYVQGLGKIGNEVKILLDIHKTLRY